MKKAPLAILTLTVLIAGAQSAFGRNSHNDWYDFYGKLRWSDECYRLDGMAQELLRDSSVIGYIAVFRLKGESKSSASKHIKKIKKYLLARWRIPEKQLIFIDAGPEKYARVILQPVKGDYPAPVF